MSNKELARKTEVERVLDQRITQKEAAKKLEVSERQFRSILYRYRQEGDGGLVPGNVGSKQPKDRHRDREEVRKFVCDPIMKGFGPTLMAEKLGIKKGILLSKETVRQLMIESDVWKVKSKKKEEPHYSRPRRKCRGELVQIDGSEHAWLEDRGPKATLLVYVDDATSEILAAEFVPEESFFAMATCANVIQGARPSQNLL